MVGGCVYVLTTSSCQSNSCWKNVEHTSMSRQNRLNITRLSPSEAPDARTSSVTAALPT